MSDDILDDFLADFDIGSDPLAPLTSEEFVMQRLTEGKNPRMHIVRYNLIREFKTRDILRSRGITFRKNTMVDGQPQNKELSDLEYARAINELYVMQTCAETLKFAEGEGRNKVNMTKLLDLICDHEPIRDTINNTHGLR